MMEVPQMDTKEDKVTTSTDSEMHTHRYIYCCPEGILITCIFMEIGQGSVHTRAHSEVFLLQRGKEKNIQISTTSPHCLYVHLFLCSFSLFLR